MYTLRTISVGRSLERDVVLDDASVSRRHAEITLARDHRIFVIDAASGAGTQILRDGSWIPVRQEYLNPGERIRFGTLEFDAGRVMQWLETPGAVHAAAA